MPPAKRSTGKALTWKQARPAPVVLVTGPESLLVDRAAARVQTQARQAHEQVEATRVEAASYQPGTLARLASPSLFEEHRMVTVVGLAEANDLAVTEVLAYLDDPQPDVVLVLCHGGGVRAKKLVDRAKTVPDVVWVDCPAIKRDNELLSFVGQEFADARRTISSPAAQLLVDAFGSDLRELAASCAQLMSDIDTDIDIADVQRYYGGRAEASGFEVADAVVARDAGRALLTVRRALDSGVDPIPMLAAIAVKLRQLAKVSVATGAGGQVAKELGMAPWMVDQARRHLRNWPPDDLAAAIIDVAAADVALKGGVEIADTIYGRTADPVYTMERLVVTACGG
ncbi:MAG: DNA polymerase III subunit delta [Actinomycetales bacterium]